VNAPRAAQGPKRTPRPGQDRRASDRSDNGRDAARASAVPLAVPVPDDVDAHADGLGGDDTAVTPAVQGPEARSTPRYGLGDPQPVIDEAPEPLEPAVPQVRPPAAPAHALPASEARRGRRGRRVKRVVRRIELWSVLKLALLLYTCLYITTMAALAAVWNVAYSSGQIDKLQSFLGDVGLENYRFYGDQMFRACLAIGGIGVLAGTLLTVLTAALINVISEVTGGIRLVVIEEEPAPSA
jgi:hypothetical protein